MIRILDQLCAVWMVLNIISKCIICEYVIVIASSKQRMNRNHSKRLTNPGGGDVVVCTDLSGKTPHTDIDRWAWIG